MVENTMNNVTVIGSTCSICDALDLTLSAPILASDLPTLSFNGGAVLDSAFNSLARFGGLPIGKSDDLDDTPPRILYANATAPNTIDVAFSENVYSTDSESRTWTLSGDDAGALSVDSAFFADGDRSIVSLQLNGSLPDTEPDLTLEYSDVEGDYADESGNELVGASVEVADGLEPLFFSATAVTPELIELAFSEPVEGGANGFAVRVNANTVGISPSTGNDTIILALDTRMTNGDTVFVSYERNSGDVRDASGNRLDDFDSQLVDTETRDITPPTIASARAILLDTILVTFSEDVDTDYTNGTGWSLGGDDAGVLVVTANTDPGGSSMAMNLTLSGDLPDTEPDLTLIYDMPNFGGITDGNYRLDNATGVMVSDGIAPAFASAVYATGDGLLTVTFSEPLSDTVDLSKLHVRDSGQSSGGTLTGAAQSVAGSALTVTLTPEQRTAVESLGTPQLDIDAGAVSDLNSNEITASPDNAITVDDTAPPAFSSATYSTGSGALVVTFSEPLSGTADLSKLHVRDSGQSSGGATLTGAAQSVAGSALTVTLTPEQRTAVESLGTPQLDIDAGAVSDLNSNEITASLDNAITVADTTPPVPTISSTAGADGSTTGTAQIPFSVSFDESVTGFVAGDVTVGGTGSPGAVPGFTGSGAGPYTFTVTAASDGIVTVTVPANVAQDSSGNDNTASGTYTITYDGTGPAPVLTTTSASPTNAGSVVVTVDFGEPIDPATFAIADVLVASGTASNLTPVSGNQNFTFTLTPASDGEVTASIPSGRVADPAGNGNAASNTIRITFDRAAPVITIVGSGTVSLSVGDGYTDKGASCTDETDPNPTLTDNATAVNANAVGTYDITYTCTDAAGNGATTIRALNVIDWDSADTATFVTTWEATASDLAITIPVGGAAGEYTVNWGDGTASPDVTGDRSHTYADPGNYTVSILGDFTRILINDAANNADQPRAINQWGDIQWESMNSAFKGASNMAYLAADVPDLSRVTDTASMFNAASSFDGDISAWNVSNVTDMTGMFNGASAFNSDISAWNVSKVTRMGGMFSGATSFNGDLRSWDVSKVTSMNSMFSTSLAFNSDISGWDVSKVTDMTNMFDGASAFMQNLGNWYVVLDDLTLGQGERVVGPVMAQNSFLPGRCRPTRSTRPSATAQSSPSTTSPSTTPPPTRWAARTRSPSWWAATASSGRRTGKS